MSVDPNSSVPIFQQIANHIRRSVAAGIFRNGEKLPSTRGLAIELGVNPNTVQRAYEDLERDGLIEVRRGVGLFVTAGATAAAQRHSADGLYEAFAQAIRAGRFARLSPDDIEAIFRRALENTNRHEPMAGGET